MAKAGLNALTLGLAGAWAPKVRANLVLPGAFDTDITKAWDPDMKARIGTINPMRRIGRPEDMVGVCVFLASDAAQLRQRGPGPRRRRLLPVALTPTAGHRADRVVGHLWF